MISKNELEKLFSDENINIYHAIASDDMYETKCLQLAKFNIDDFVNFIKNNKILTVFYEYFRYNEDAYFMDYNEFDDISDEVMDVINNDIEEYNHLTESIDYSKPYILKLFCSCGNLTVFISIVDDWLTESGIIPAGAKLEELLDTYESTLDDIFKNREERRRKLLNELTDFIKSDPEFLKCTNANFRRSYFHDLAEREETQKYIEVIKDDDGYMNQEVNMLIQELWRDYRLNKNKATDES